MDLMNANRSTTDINPNCIVNPNGIYNTNSGSEQKEIRPCGLIGMLLIDRDSIYVQVCLYIYTQVCVLTYFK